MTKNRKERPSHNESRSFLFILISYLENAFQRIAASVRVHKVYK